MALKILKPVTPSSRGVVRVDHSKIVSANKPYKKLLKPTTRLAGRSRGKISMMHKGGGVKKFYRLIDFSRTLRNIEGTVSSIELDPNRNVYIALISYRNGVKSYILAPNDLKIGKTVIAGDNVTIDPGNALPLMNIPVGTLIHNIEINPGSGGTLVRSAGLSATILGFDKGFAQIRMPSKEVRLVNELSYATIGALSNADYKNIVLGKAGVSRRKGIRPTVRGMVKPPNAHPHGGGEAKGVIGHIPRDTWGNVRGKKTRRKRNRFDRFRLVDRKGRKIVVK